MGTKLQTAWHLWTQVHSAAASNQMVSFARLPNISDQPQIASLTLINCIRPSYATHASSSTAGSRPCEMLLASKAAAALQLAELTGCLPTRWQLVRRWQQMPVNFSIRLMAACASTAV